MELPKYFLNFINRTIAVNLAIFRDISSVSTNAAPTGLSFLVTRCYKHAAETPKQINATRLKRVLKSSRLLCKIRCG